MTSNSNRTKRIFVSDIHMGDEESLHPPGELKPWGWLGAKRAQMFADFLAKIYGDPAVKQVIILGDLFDEWVCPAEISPVPDKSESTNQFQKIANAAQNRPAINMLQKIASSKDIELIYVPGNHDMLMTRPILEEIIPGIQYMGESQGVGLFNEEGIFAEHGSLYCLFNAPDNYNNPGHVLPLGYFITRAVAEHAAHTGSKHDIFKVIKDVIQHIKMRDQFAKLVFESIAEYAGLSSDSDIIMNNINSYAEKIKVEEVENIFGNLYSEWEKEMKNNVSKEQALTDDMGFLYPAAITQYFMKKKSEIVIFGHTHDYEIHGIISSDLEDDIKEAVHEHIPCSHIYANSGTWIDSKKKCTFVETQIDVQNKQHIVRVNQYTDSGDICVLGHRFIDLAKTHIIKDFTTILEEFYKKAVTH